MAQELSGMKVAIIATQGFEESELTEPKKALEAAGAKTVVISQKPGKIQAVRHDEKSIQVDVDMTFDQVQASEFDGVQIPGGALNADTLRVVPEAQEFVRQMDRKGKPIAVICHGPWPAGFRRAGARSQDDQLSHHPGRHPQRRRRMAGRGVRAR
jgi:protease I